MSPDPEQPKKTHSSAGTTLLAIPFMLVGFTAAMIHVPVEPPPPTPPQLLAERQIERSPNAAVAAADTDDLYVLRLLTRCGLDMDSADDRGVTPLMAAARSGSAETMRWLLRNEHVSLETTDADGLTAIAYATAAGNIDRVEQLAAAGAYPGVHGIDGRPPIRIAATADNTLMVATLLKLGEREGLFEAVAEAISQRRLKTADTLLAAQDKTDPARNLAQRATLLHEAVRAGEQETIALLLRYRAPIDTTDAEGRTPLGTAIETGQAWLCSLLIDAGAALDSPCAGQRSPLQLAWARRDHSIARHLLEHGAAPHPGIVSDAAEEGAFDFVRLLADYGAPLDVPLADGDTMLTRALAEGDQSRAADLLEIGASPDALGKEGQPALAAAVARRDVAATRLLLDAGADPNIVLADPVSDAFHELVESKNLSFYLKRDRRFTPLMIAAGTGDGDVIRALLAGGASRSKYTRSYKRYPISFASNVGHILAQQLITGYDPATRKDQFKITIDLSSQRATLYKNGKAVNSSNVSTGKKGHRTPTGKYVVTHKHRDHISTLYDSPMPYFMRLSCGAFGTHTGNCPGYPASHGCIRMPNHKAREFFNATPAGTAVTIVP